MTGCDINPVVASAFPWCGSLEVEELPLSAMMPDAFKSRGWGNGRMQFISLKVDTASSVTLSTWHCLWFSLVIWYAYSCCWGSAFLSCYLYTFHALSECFWRCAFISIAFSAISRSGIPAVLPLAEKGGGDFSLVLEYPTVSFLLVSSTSFFTLHSSTVCSLFASRFSRIVLLFPLGTSAGTADWNSLSILSFILQPLLG